jgi:hypothetical protein
VGIVGQWGLRATKITGSLKAISLDVAVTRKPRWRRSSHGRAGMWRRARDPAVEAAWAGFLRFARALDEGSRALLATVPSARRAGAPLPAAVAGFLAGVEAARAELPAWALPDLAEAQAATVAALDAAARRARDLPAAADGLDFEHRNERVAEVLDELAPV